MNGVDGDLQGEDHRVLGEDDQSSVRGTEKDKPPGYDLGRFGLGMINVKFLTYSSPGLY